MNYYTCFLPVQLNHYKIFHIPQKAPFSNGALQLKLFPEVSTRDNKQLGYSHAAGNRPEGWVRHN